ncbi:hypothetical protein CEXT_70081 [Caerostris extrusa]|uniref:Uncharacterized protein n=1 Tax=Caerostris extrusa TaxID=172846 RepID=A0AAV4U6L3_CAEEX|nr:hypothetical protein CEXT_70081 [Caerostris extrusa]
MAAPAPCPLDCCRHPEISRIAKGQEGSRGGETHDKERHASSKMFFFRSRRLIMNACAMISYSKYDLVDIPLCLNVRNTRAIITKNYFESFDFWGHVITRLLGTLFTDMELHRYEKLWLDSKYWSQLRESGVIRGVHEIEP